MSLPPPKERSFMSENTTETVKEEVKTQPAQEAQPKPVLKEGEENRLSDPDAIDAFVAMGYKLPLSDSLVGFYQFFKKKKDTIYPGKVSPEGLAFLALLDEMYKRLKK